MAQSYDDQISPIIFVVFKAQRYQVEDWINWLLDLEDLEKDFGNLMQN